MRVQDYLSKISWTAGDKILFVVYGFVTLLQIRAIAPLEYGLYAFIVSLQTWIFILSDGAALQSLIQFGMEKEKRPQVNAVSLMLHTCIVMGSSLIVALFHSPLSLLFSEPRFESVALWLPLYCLMTLPRAYCVKILLRDTQMRQIFWINFAWFGSMSAVTAWMLWNHALQGFDDMIVITFSGMTISSLTALALTRDLLRFSFDGKSAIRDVARFGSVQVMIGAITNAIRQLDVFLLQFFFTDLAIVGIYQAAKTLYRIFETGMDALFSLIYPAAVRMLPFGRRDEFSILLSKAVSYLFLSYLTIIVLMELGLTQVLVTVLGQHYAHVVMQFNLLAIAALFIPFYPLSAVMLAQHKNTHFLKYVMVASFSGLATFIACGLTGQSSLFPSGIIVYNAVLSALLVMYVQRELGLAPTAYLRAAGDSWRYLRGRLTPP